LSDADIDKRVIDRADLIATAKQIADKDYTGLSDEEIKSAAVVAKLGQATVDGKSADYISARFDILSEDATQDPVRKVIKNGEVVTGDSVDQAHAAMVDGLQNAWMGTHAEGK